ncbi:MAG: beta-L-arabinofuranosidase domain-containing protein, partial [Armatimonadota bacterium]
MEKRMMRLQLPAAAHFRFDGPMGERIEANVDNWLPQAPIANPGMIEMFRRRDREPAPDLVPWAGEFIGKYLISAIQACRMSDDPRLKPFVADVIREFISTQAEDGYLGPFRKEERLLGHWDLWGHYHAMLALLTWHEDTGDERALRCATRATDLACDTYLDGERRVFDAGSHEMNMAIIHLLGRLYRVTGEDRYLRMARQIEKEWETPGAGDYFRTGLEGIDFFRTPKPRWESLHDLQGLVELFQITGDERYKRAFVQHWTSIRNYDRHPSGGFSTGEQAIGSPYSDGAIETCCTTAWMALTVDMLRLTGDPAAADELELSTWNSTLGSQHPSGRWWTYDTPMDGVREVSA